MSLNIIERLNDILPERELQLSTLRNNIEVLGFPHEEGEFFLCRGVCPKDAGSDCETSKSGLSCEALGGVIQEIVKRKRIEVSLRKEKIASEEKARNVMNFLANTSHELRTPLNAILGFSEMIMLGMHSTGGRDNTSNYVRNIHNAGNHLLSLINDLLDLAKIDNEKLDLRETAFEVADLVDEAVEMMRDRVHASGLELNVHVADGLPWVRLDKRRILQAILNLLSNAVKFTPDGGEVTLYAGRGEDGGILIRVEDTGVGMKESDIPKALAEFGQVEHSLEQNTPSTGLGLPMAKRLVELHGGSLELYSWPKEGTTVSLRFPPERWCLD